MTGVLKIRNPGTGKFEDIPAIVGPAGKGFPAGGATGQVLKKVSDNDYDAEWSDAATGNVASVNGKTPDASGTVTLSATDIGYGNSDVGSSLSQLKDDILSKKISLVKIYENANTESEFGWQTIPIAGEGYNLYILCCKRAVDSILTGTNILIKGCKLSMILIPDSSTGDINKRAVSISNSGNELVFDGGFKNSSPDNKSIIPVSLYGVSIDG